MSRWIISGVILLLTGCGMFFGKVDDRRSSTVFYLDLRKADLAAEAFPTVVCQGLINRELKRPAVFVNFNKQDEAWMHTMAERLAGKVSWEKTTPRALIAWARAEGIVKGQVLWNPDEPQSMNNATVLCALHDAIPVSPALEPFADKLNLKVAQDVRGKWTDDMEAARWGIERLLPRCDRTRLVQMGPTVELRDFAVAERLFCMRVDGRELGPDRALLHRAIEGSHYGADALVLGRNPGNEVTAQLTKNHSQPSLLSDQSANLSFYSRFPEVTEIHQSEPEGDVHYDSDHTYLALILSGGKSLNACLGNLRKRMDERREIKSIFPLGWTLPSAMTKLAPPVLRWYYEQARKTGLDSFLLGPSGAGYLYPSINFNRRDFAEKTDQAAQALDMDGYVHFDLAGNAEAVNESIAAYADTHIRGVFTPVAPPPPAFVGDIPVFEEAYYWQRVDAAAPGGMTPVTLAMKLSQPEHKGELRYLYIDSSIPLKWIEDLTMYLAAHVELVDYRDLIDLARQKRKAEKN